MSKHLIFCICSTSLNKLSEISWNPKGTLRRVIGLPIRRIGLFEGVGPLTLRGQELLEPRFRERVNVLEDP